MHIHISLEVTRSCVNILGGHGLDIDINILQCACEWGCSEYFEKLELKIELEFSRFKNKSNMHISGQRC